MRTIEITRDMDHFGMSEMEDLFSSMAKGSDDVCLDLSRVQFLDGAGISGMMELYHDLRRRSRKFGIVGAQGQPLRLLLEVLRGGNLGRDRGQNLH